MYIFGYELNLVYVLILANIGVILALVLVLLELRDVRKLRKSFEHMFGQCEEVLEKDTKIFWKELEQLKSLVDDINSRKA